MFTDKNKAAILILSANVDTTQINNLISGFIAPIRNTMRKEMQGLKDKCNEDEKNLKADIVRAKGDVTALKKTLTDNLKAQEDIVAKILAKAK